MQSRQLSRRVDARPSYGWCNLSCLIILVVTFALMVTSIGSARSKSSKEMVSVNGVATMTTTTTETVATLNHRNHHRHHQQQQQQQQQHQLYEHKVKGVQERTLSVNDDSGHKVSDLSLLDALLLPSVSTGSDLVSVDKSSTRRSGGSNKQLQRQEQKQDVQQKQKQTASNPVVTSGGTEGSSENGEGTSSLYPNYDQPYITSNCSRCRMLEETINLTKEAIKQQILSKLGLKQPPNITGRVLPRIPPLNHLLDMYGMQSDAPGMHAFKPGPVFEEAEDDYHAKTEKVISFAQKPPTSWSLPSNMEVQYFKFSHSVMVSKVIRANLWIYLTPPKAVQEAGTLVHVYKVSRTESSGGTVMAHVLSSKVHDLKPRGGGWVAVDIRKLAFEWFRYPQTNLGIVVQAFDQEGLQLVANGQEPYSDASLVPFVEVYTMDESKRRTKRMIGLNCEENSNEVRCCRYPLTVDFEEFGWDWIIAPKKYEANYCSGECPFVFLQKYPHTHLVQQANPSGSAGPCCAPRKMSPISMLYFDNEYNIIYGLLPGMVVDRCSCS